MTSPKRHDDFDRLLETAHRGAIPERSSCPDPATVASYVDNALSRGERAAFERHAADCARCAEAIALLAGLDETEGPGREIPAASRWLWWRWLVPLATVVIVLIVWRELPPPDADRAVSDAKSPAATSAEPAAPRAVPVPPAEPVPEREQRRQPLLKESVPESPRESAPDKLQAPPERLEQRNAAPSAADARAQRFDAPTAEDEARMRGTPLPPAVSAPAPAAKGELRSQRAESMTAGVSGSLEVRSLDGAASYRVLAGHTVQRSTDGGHNWAVEPTPDVSGLRAGSAPTRDVCWIAGAGGTVLRRSSTGTWRFVSLPQALDIVEIVSSSETAAVVTTADGGRWRTTDGGVHWEPEGAGPG